MAKKSKKARNTVLQKFLLIVNFVFITAIFLSYLAPDVNPKTNIIPAIFGLLYPAFFLINFIFLIWWIISWKKYFIFPLIAMLLGYGVFLKNVRFNKEKLIREYSDALKILSYNVRLFDQYKAKGNDTYFTRNAIFDFVKSENANIVCFQEFFHGNEKYFPTIGPFLESQKAKNYHVDYIKTISDNRHYGLATFSAFPIVKRGEIHFENSANNSGIYTDILYKEDTIRVFNFHLESIKFSNADYQFVSEFIDPEAQNQTSSKIIIWKLKNAFIKRAEQAQVASDIISKSPYPVIVCGDFNDTPSSYTYRTITRHLDDAFQEAGQGIGSTYAGDIPFLRIDFILHSPELEAFKYKKHICYYSDHFPVSCYFKIKDDILLEN
jgi:endonuclease/exonuclease/phosphatase family metal-dependent hydrolase